LSGYDAIAIAQVEVKIEQQRRDGVWEPIWDPEWRAANFIAGTPVMRYC
jgi:hypothetical protein